MRAVVSKLEGGERVLSLEKPKVTREDVETLLDMATSSHPHVALVAEVKVHNMTLMQVVRPAPPVEEPTPAKPWYRRLF